MGLERSGIISGGHLDLKPLGYTLWRCQTQKDDKDEISRMKSVIGPNYRHDNPGL